MALAVFQRAWLCRLAQRDACASGVEHADGFVRQLAAGDVAIGKTYGLHQRFVHHGDLVMLLHLRQQPTKHVDGLVFVRLFDFHDLETTSQCGVFFEILFVFCPCGGGDGAQLATRQGRLEQVRCVVLPGLATRADQRVGFVDEQNDRVQAALGFFDDRLEAVFELAFDPCTCLQQAQIQGVNGDALEHRRHVALHDAQRQTFNHGCFTHTRFTSQDRVVLTAAGQDVDHLPHFELASQYRIDTTIAGALGQVDGVLVQGRGLAVALGGCARACVGVGQRLAQFGLRAAFDQRAHIQAQVVSVDFLQFRRRTDDHAAQGIVIQQGLNQVAGADLRLTEFDRRQYLGRR